MYVISIDQSTQGTKAILLDKDGALLCRVDKAHRQIINEKGWVSQDPEEIYQNTIEIIRHLIRKTGIDKNLVAGIAISNQRETSLIWDATDGKPVANAIVWQCARAAEICEREEIKSHADHIFEKTGMNLSPYFPAAKIAWLLEHVEEAKTLIENGKLRCGTMDAYLIYRLTAGKSYKTDYSNASRTQLFNVFDLTWDKEICAWFRIPAEILPEVVDSDALFGMTNCEGIFDKEIPIHAAMGDSHAALFGQHCLQEGMTKATYGTGSSIMMNIGSRPVLSTHGVVTSLAWGKNGRVEYVLEGNLNYTGAVITWLQKDLKLIDDPSETENLARQAQKDDEVYLIPAFTGLGAPYWKPHAKAAILGMDRTTGRAEIVRAGLECIAYQIHDVIRAMEKDAGISLNELRVDGGPTKNTYLMQFQCDMIGSSVAVPEAEELSAIGAGYMAGLALGLWDEHVFSKVKRTIYVSEMDLALKEKKLNGWKEAVEMGGKIS